MKTSLYNILICLVVIGLLATGCFAAEQPQPRQENKVIKFFKDVIIWPFGITKQGANTVARTTEKATTTVTNTSVSAVETVTGKPEKIKNVITDPIKGSGETAYTAVEGSVKTPIEGTKDAFK